MPLLVLGRADVAGDAVALSDSGARQLDADNVLVLRELDDEVGRQVDAGRRAREVVDHDGQGRGVGDLDKEVVDGLRVAAHGESKVARVDDDPEERKGKCVSLRGRSMSGTPRKGHKREVGAGLLGLLCELDGLARALATGADEERDVLEIGAVERLARLRDDEDALLGLEVARLTVRAVDDLAVRRQRRTERSAPLRLIPRFEGQNGPVPRCAKQSRAQRPSPTRRAGAGISERNTKARGERATYKTSAGLRDADGLSGQCRDVDIAVLGEWADERDKDLGLPKEGGGERRSARAMARDEPATQRARMRGRAAKERRTPGENWRAGMVETRGRE